LHKIGEIARFLDGLFVDGSLRRIGKTAGFCGAGRGKRRKKTGFFEKISFRLFHFGAVSGMLKNREFVFKFEPATLSTCAPRFVEVCRALTLSGGVFRRLRPVCRLY
jgi:hypothetical protein